MLQKMALYHPFSWLCNIPVCVCLCVCVCVCVSDTLFVHSFFLIKEIGFQLIFFGGHLACFCVLTIVNSGAMNLVCVRAQLLQ